VIPGGFQRDHKKPLRVLHYLELSRVITPRGLSLAKWDRLVERSLLAGKWHLYFENLIEVKALFLWENGTELL